NRLNCTQEIGRQGYHRSISSRGSRGCPSNCPRGSPARRWRTGSRDELLEDRIGRNPCPLLAPDRSASCLGDRGCPIIGIVSQPQTWFLMSRMGSGGDSFVRILLR